MLSCHVCGEVFERIYTLDDKGTVGLVFHERECTAVFKIHMSTVLIHMYRNPGHTFEAGIIGYLAVDEVAQ